MRRYSADRDQEAASPDGWIADHVLRLRRHQFHHHRDDVARGAELAVLAGGGDLRQHVFIDVALGVARAHLELVELIDDLGEKLRAWNLKARIAHMPRIGAALPVEFANERKHMLVDDLEHSSRLEMLEARPAEILVGLAGIDRFAGLDGFAAPIKTLGENTALQRRAERCRLALLQFLHLVEAFDEDQVGDLLDHLQRIGETARLEIVPDAVDLVAQLTRQHVRFLNANAISRIEVTLPHSLVWPIAPTRSGRAGFRPRLPGSAHRSAIGARASGPDSGGPNRR